MMSHPKKVEKGGIQRTIPTLCIVVPCYNEEESIETTWNTLQNKLLCLIGKGLISGSSFICFVNDGSNDGTLQIVKDIKHRVGGPPGEGPILGDTRIVSLSRNFGHQNALLAGLNFIRDKCDVSISIDCDLQDDVDVMENMVINYMAGSEVVYGVRDVRGGDGFLKRNTACLFYKLLTVIGLKIVHNHADFRLLSSRALSSLLSLILAGGGGIFIRGTIPMLGYKSSVVLYHQRKRRYGRSKYTLKKMLSLALTGIVRLSITPIRAVGVVGALLSAIAFLLGIFLMFLNLLLGMHVQTWSWVVLSIYFVGGIQLLGIYVVGEYVGRSYLESKSPKFIIENVD